MSNAYLHSDEDCAPIWPGQDRTLLTLNAAFRRWMSSFGFALALVVSANASCAGAEVFPDRPVQMIVSVGAGGSTDTMMRALVQYAAPNSRDSVVNPLMARTLCGFHGCSAPAKWI
jgi:hypothetical protein